MYRIFLVLFLLPVLFCNQSEPVAKIPSLKLINAYPVEGPPNIQPSGLTIWRDTLFTVSDKHDDTIFKIIVKADKAILVPHIIFSPPENNLFKKLDFEGITCDKQGNFYIASEMAIRILKVSAAKDTVKWITPDLRPFGMAAGLFQRRNAYIEGITYTELGKFILCAEREPRGIIEVNTLADPISVFAYQMDQTKFQKKENVGADFTGLDYDYHELYALGRNSFTICTLKFDGTTYREIKGWSFRSTEVSDNFKYKNMKYGRAEGLAVDSNYFYVILDNNNDPKFNNPDDRRPLLFIFERPNS